MTTEIMDVDSAEDTADQPVTLAFWVDKIRERQADVDRLTTELKAAQDGLNDLLLHQVPEVMEEAHLTESTLEDGAKITLKKDVNVNITEINREAAHRWLTEQGHGMSIRRMLQVDLRTLDDNDARDMVTSLTEAFDAEPVVTQSLHAATLKSIVVQMLEKGVQIPECIGVYEFKKVKIKEPRN